jgi:hypothetical protein
VPHREGSHRPPNLRSWLWRGLAAVLDELIEVLDAYPYPAAADADTRRYQLPLRYQGVNRCLRTGKASGDVGNLQERHVLSLPV